MITISLKSPEVKKGLELLKKLKSSFPNDEHVIVGGAVRDLVLGEKEVNDIDIATSTPIEEIEKHFKTHSIGQSKDFGIALVEFKETHFEVANFRTDGDYTDNRRPDEVHLVKTFKEDSFRRDFTFNALAIDSKCEIVDYHNGLEDLKRHHVRCVGDPNKRFQEDALRIIRAIRFAATLGFVIEQKTQDAIRANDELLNNISIERFTQELYKAAKDGESLVRFIILLDNFGLLVRFLPEINDLKFLSHKKEHHPEGGNTPYGATNVLGHVIECLKHSRSSVPLVNLAILFHDIGKGQTFDAEKLSFHRHEGVGANMMQEVSERLKLSGGAREAIAFACQRHMVVHDLTNLRSNTLAKLVHDKNWPLLKEVCFADAASRGPDLFDEKEFLNKIKWAETQVAKMGATDDALRIRIKEYIDGNKVMEWCPDLPSNKIGEVLLNVQNWIGDAFAHGFPIPSDKSIEEFTRSVASGVLKKNNKNK